ncbi:MgtC/SapB family protein [Haloimpatiens sp. FM7330]|uniref:MgtC/SapB family protein n=1 Tax=Haloimpatiens sp. FM7330 TaxID=3298610 RepID=UPI003644030B
MERYEVIIRLALAILIGGLIGYEREFKNRPAGFRTHILVCVGAAVISMIQIYDVDKTTAKILAHPELGAALKVDIGRLGAQVITGIGFLGAGTIIREKGAVKGLTTAASIWTVACIGLGIGMGYYFLSAAAAIGVLIILVSLKRLETKLFEKGKLVKLEIYYVSKEFIQDAAEFFRRKNIKVKNIEFNIEDEDEDVYNSSLYTVIIPRYVKVSSVIQELSTIEGVVKIMEV